MNLHLARVRGSLEAAGLTVTEVRPLPNGTGDQIRCAGGELVSVYRTWSVVLEGKHIEAVEAGAITRKT